MTNISNQNIARAKECLNFLLTAEEGDKFVFAPGGKDVIRKVLEIISAYEQQVLALQKIAKGGADCNFQEIAQQALAKEGK